LPFNGKFRVTSYGNVNVLSANTFADNKLNASDDEYSLKPGTSYRWLDCLPACTARILYSSALVKTPPVFLGATLYSTTSDTPESEYPELHIYIEGIFMSSCDALFIQHLRYFI
jgi:hypothetical protein